jgi:tetratricopeptide (TPR) repeat protein
MRTLALVCLCARLFAAPLGPAERASAETLLAALSAAPFADEPLAAIERIYERGPGRAALVQLSRQRAATDPRFLVVEGRVELSFGMRADGVKSLTKAAATEKDPANLRRLAQLLDDAGARAPAIAAYRGSIAGANAVEARHLQLRLGALYLAENKVKDAQAAWDQAKRLGPNDVALRRQIAEALAARHAWRPALDELHALEPLVGGDRLALVGVLRRESEIARQAGDRAQSGRALLRAFLAAVDAGQPTLEAELARDLLRLYDVRPKKPSPELLSMVAALEAANPAAAAVRGEVLAASGDLAGAQKALHAALAVHPSDPYLLRRLAAIDTGEARIRDLRALFEVQRSDPALGLELEAALLDAKDSAGAKMVAQTLRQRFADDVLSLTDLARLTGKNGLHAEALAAWERVVALTPNDPDALTGWGDELKALGRDDEARAAYLRLARDGSTVSYRQLVSTLEKRKLVAEAKRAFAEAVGRHPDDLDLRRDYARWLAQNGAPTEAIAEWKRLRESTKDSFLQEFADREIKRLEWQEMLNRQ